MHAACTPWTAMAMAESMREVLRRLLACERGLVEAYARFEGAPRARALASHGVKVHMGHVAWLADCLRGDPLVDEAATDDAWVQGGSLRTAEQLSHLTWHDALTDLPPEVARHARDRLLADHHELLQEWQTLTGGSDEPSVTE